MYRDEGPCQDALVVSVLASHVVGHGFVPRLGYTKEHHKNGTNCLIVMSLKVQKAGKCVELSMGTCALKISWDQL